MSKIIGLTKYTYNICKYKRNEPIFLNEWIHFSYIDNHNGTYQEQLQQINYDIDLEIYMKDISPKHGLLITVKQDDLSWSRMPFEKMVFHFENKKRTYYYKYKQINSTDFQQISRKTEKELLDIYKPLLFNDYYNKYEKIKNPFILVQYKTKETTIDLILDSSYFLEKNHLFSSLFLIRYFEYHENNNLPFDNNYEIYIMDKQMNIVIIQSGTYIELTKDGIGYKIINENNQNSGLCS
jgi:hypothetical protein